MVGLAGEPPSCVGRERSTQVVDQNPAALWRDFKYLGKWDRGNLGSWSIKTLCNIGGWGWKLQQRWVTLPPEPLLWCLTSPGSPCIRRNSALHSNYSLYVSANAWRCCETQLKSAQCSVDRDEVSLAQRVRDKWVTSQVKGLCWFRDWVLFSETLMILRMGDTVNVSTPFRETGT